jgi:hypothetical protein
LPTSSGHRSSALASEPDSSDAGSLRPLPNPPLTAEGQVALSCGGPAFSVEVLHSARGAELADHPASAALAEAIRSRDVRSRAGWRIAHLTDNDALFLLEVRRSDGTSSWWQAEFAARGASWELVTTGTCEMRPFFGDAFGPGIWELAVGTELTADDTTVNVIVTELACASGQSAEGRVTEPAVAYEVAAVTIYFAVERLPGNQTCPGNPDLAATVRLAEPIGGRRLLDGSSYPPEQRWP